MKKRKYQKRKKPVEPAEPGATGLSKVEGTKLIIQKKAIKLATNNIEQNDSTLYGNNDPDNQNNPESSYFISNEISTTTGKPKKPRMSKKFLKSQLVCENSPMSSAQATGGDNNLKMKISLNNSMGNQKKVAKKLILKIPKDNMVASFTNNNNDNTDVQKSLEPGETGNNYNNNYNYESSGNMSLTDQSPSKKSGTPNQPKR